MIEVEANSSKNLNDQEQQSASMLSSAGKEKSNLIDSQNKVLYLLSILYY
jgi:hypothetical protein